MFSISEFTITLLIGIIIGGLAGGLALFLAHIVYDYYKRPILKVESEPFENIALAANERWKQLGLKIRNEGKSGAKKVRCKLTIKNFKSDEDVVDTRVLIGKERIGRTHIIGKSNTTTDVDEILNQMRENAGEHRVKDTITTRKLPANFGVFIDRPVPGIEFKDKELCWNWPNTPPEIDINKNDTEAVFIARLRYVEGKDDEFDQLDIPCGYPWDKAVNVILLPEKEKEYKCEAKVTSENAEEVRVSFTLDTKHGRILFI